MIQHFAKTRIYELAEGKDKFEQVKTISTIYRFGGISKSLSAMGYSHFYRKTKKVLLQMLRPIHQKLRIRHALLAVFHYCILGREEINASRARRSRAGFRKFQ